MKYLALFLLILSGCAAKAPQKTCNFRYDIYGDIVRWQQLPVVMYIDSNVPVDKVSAIEKAVYNWEEAAGVDLFELRYINNAGINRDGLNVISYVHNWLRDFQSVMVTSRWVGGHMISEADVSVNIQYYHFYGLNEVPNGFSMERVMTHELGHVLGMEHDDDEDSVMYPYAIMRNSNGLAPIDVWNVRCGYN